MTRREWLVLRKCREPEGDGGVHPRVRRQGPYEEIPIIDQHVVIEDWMLPGQRLKGREEVARYFLAPLGQVPKELQFEVHETLVDFTGVFVREYAQETPQPRSRHAGRRSDRQPGTSTSSGVEGRSRSLWQRHSDGGPAARGDSGRPAPVVRKGPVD